jgi:hypothetical protein
MDPLNPFRRSQIIEPPAVLAVTPVLPVAAAESPSASYPFA